MLHRGVFKESADGIAEALRNNGYIVLINETKPRKGSFVVTRGNGEKIVELLNLQPPFYKLRGLDIEQVIETIMETH